jgi:hypothetical protein
MVGAVCAAVVLASCSAATTIKSLAAEARTTLVTEMAIGTWRCTHNVDQTATAEISSNGVFLLRHEEPDRSNDFTWGGSWKVDGSRLTTHFARNASADDIVFVGIPRHLVHDATVTPGTADGKTSPSDAIKVHLEGSKVVFEVAGPHGPEYATCTRTSHRNPNLAPSTANYSRYG